jgi:hypothetical protein
MHGLDLPGHPGTEDDMAERDCAVECQKGCAEASRGTPENCPQYETVQRTTSSVLNMDFDRLMELAEEGAMESRLRGIGQLPSFEDLPPDVRDGLTQK